MYLGTSSTFGCIKYQVHGRNYQNVIINTENSTKSIELNNIVYSVYSHDSIYSLTNLFTNSFITPNYFFCYYIFILYLY